MSEISSKKIDSLLPEDVEAKLANIQAILANLDKQKLDLEIEIKDKTSQVEKLREKTAVAEGELEKINSVYQDKIKTINEKEAKLSQRESTLDVFATALSERERKIKRYIEVFENMKNVISK